MRPASILFGVLFVVTFFCSGIVLAVSKYEIVLLGPLDDRSSAYGINDVGVVVGGSSAGPFMHDGSELTTLIPEGVSNNGGARARAINNSGQVVLNGFGSYLYDGTTFTAIAESGFSSVQAWDISDAGHITGRAQPDNSTGQRAFLGPEPGATGSTSTFGMAVNDSGQVVGDSFQFTPNAGGHGFLYSGGTISLVGGDTFESEARDINNAGRVVGYSRQNVSSPYHGFVTNNGQLMDLGAGFEPQAINEGGQIVGGDVGTSYLGSAKLYQDGELHLLDDLIVGDDMGLQIGVATDINESGQIAATARTANGINVAVRLDPTKQKVVLAWGQPVNYEVQITTGPNGAQVAQPTFDTDVVQNPFMTPQGQEVFLDLYKEDVRQRVEKQFMDSGIENVEVVNGSAESNATNVFLIPNSVPGPIGASETDRFNRKAAGMAAVRIRGYGEFGDQPELDAEAITHEIAHTLGLKHVNPSQNNAPGDTTLDSDSAVMDYDQVPGDVEVFFNGPFKITEPPQSGGTELNVTHNPLYHLKRFVDRISREELEQQGIHPGAWDREEFDQALLQLLLTTPAQRSPDTQRDLGVQSVMGRGAGEPDLVLYDVHVFESDDLETAQLINYFDAITLDDLAETPFFIDELSFFRLFAASEQGGELDIALSVGDSFDPDSMILSTNVGASTAFLRMESDDPAGFSTLATITVQASIVPEPTSSMLMAIALVTGSLVFQRAGVHVNFHFT
jgi:probable HAF family extracellular repeat protein